MEQQAQEQKKGRFRYVIIDTLNQLMNDKWAKLMSQNLRTYDQWKDYGIEIYDLINFIKVNMGVEPILVLGMEGTGKTVGGAKLDPNCTYWINADKKPLTFFGARNKYNLKNRNYFEANDYEGVKKALIGINNNKVEKLIVFLLGHIEIYKSEEDTYRQRLKVLSKVATKLNIEGAVTHCYYTYIDPNKQGNDVTRYKLAVHNSGSNTCRTPQGYFEDSIHIANDYRLIVDKIYEDWGVEHREIKQEKTS